MPQPPQAEVTEEAPEALTNVVENKKPFFGEVALRKRRRLLGKQKGFCNLASCCGPTVAGSTSAGPVDMKLENRLAEVDVEPPPPKGDFQWPCPVCNAGKMVGSSAALSASKKHHLRSRHPTFNLSFFPPRKLEVAQASASLPTDQRDWSCPVPGCGKGLPALTAPRRLKAIAHHCKTEHPGHTPTSLHHLAPRGRPKKSKGVSRLQTRKHEKTRKTIHGSHDIVGFVPKFFPKDRGQLFFCKRCLSRLSTASSAKNLQSPGQTRTHKRLWWLRLQSNNPQHAKEILEATGMTVQTVNALLGLKTEDTCESLGFPSQRTPPGNKKGERRAALARSQASSAKQQVRKRPA